MKTSGVIIAAAVAGLFAGVASAQAAAPLAAAPSVAAVMGTTARANGEAINFAGVQSRPMDAATAGKHDCKGMNSCKGEGGCKSSDNGCKGKNTCKGKGGCNTSDGTQPAK